MGIEKELIDKLLADDVYTKSPNTTEKTADHSNFPLSPDPQSGPQKQWCSTTFAVLGVSTEL
jgi:hypothetical protein